MAFLLQPRSQSRGGTQWDSQVPGARASTAPREAAPFPPPLPAGTCLPSPQPILCLHCFLLPALSSHHTFTWSLSNCRSDPAFALDHPQGLRNVIWPLSAFLSFSVKQGHLSSWTGFGNHGRPLGFTGLSKKLGQYNVMPRP